VLPAILLSNAQRSPTVYQDGVQQALAGSVPCSGVHVVACIELWSVLLVINASMHFVCVSDM